MSVFDCEDYDAHEQVCFFEDPHTGLQAIVAIHNTNLGPALGGVRMWPYASDDDALRDVLRLSRGMTYKSALAGLDLGGGKAVVIGDPRRDKSEALMRALGRCVDRLGGRYIAAEDSGTGVEDMRCVAKETRHVTGILDKATTSGGTRSGDPSPATARGVFVGLRAAAAHAFGSADLAGLEVAVQGVGSVGARLVEYLVRAGAECRIADVFPERLARVAEQTGARPVESDAIYDLDVDIFAPCALGAILNDDTIGRLRARVVAGAANNQLERDCHGEALMRRGILYAPDYVINAGGIIDVAQERAGYEPNRVRDKVDAIADSLTAIFRRAEAENRPTAVVADEMARERFLRPGRPAPAPAALAAASP